jgi:CubicO group peptidase (beta-lactamase class C family)
VSRSWNRAETWIGLFVLGIGGVLAIVVGIFVYTSATATPLHDPDNLSAVTHSAPPPRWAAAVEQARQTASSAVIEQNLPGLSVAVGVGNDLVWAAGFGWADLDNKVPVTPDTRFQIGTASIVLTSAAAGLLLEKGVLKLDDEVQRYLPDFPRKGWPVTLRHVMGHLAGIRGDAGDEEPLSVRCEETNDGLERFADSSLRFEPGTQYRYSTYGWILVSAVIEAAADEPFFRFMRTQIFEPLGMNGTKVDAGTESVPDRAIFYFPRFAADPRYGPQPPREADLSCFAGAGAIVSTPSDLVRFGIAISNGKLLRRDTVEMLQASQRLPSGEETGYGLGWDNETVTLSGEPTRVVGHDGEIMAGPVSSFVIFPGRGIVVAVASNTAYADTFAIASKIAQPFAGGAGGSGSSR